MKLNIEKKENIVNVVKKLANISILTMVIEYSKIKSLDINIIRKTLFEMNVGVKVLKNTLAKKAFKDTSNNLLNAYFKGQILLIFSYNNYVLPIKTINELQNQYENFKVKAVCLYGNLFINDKISELEKLPDYSTALIKFNQKIKFSILQFINCLKIFSKNVNNNI